MSNEQKKFDERMRTLLINRQSRAGEEDNLVIPPAPRYDDVYHQGLAWLDSD